MPDADLPGQWRTALITGLLNDAQMAETRGLAFANYELRAEARIGLGRIVALYYLLILFMPESLTYLVPVFLNRQGDRTLGADGAHRRRLGAGDRGAERHRRGLAVDGEPRAGEQGAQLAQKLGQLQPSIAVFLLECMRRSRTAEPPA